MKSVKKKYHKHNLSNTKDSTDKYPTRVREMITCHGLLTEYLSIKQVEHLISNNIPGFDLGREYLSLFEHEAILREVRAQAFEEAIFMVNFRRKNHNNSLATSLRLAAETARKSRLRDKND